MIGRDLLGIEDLDRVDLERILETAERILATFDDVLAAEPTHIWAFAHDAMNFGSHDDFVADRHFLKVETGDLFALASGVNVGRIEEIDAGFEGAGEVNAGLLLVDVPAARAQSPVGQRTASIAHAA